MKIPSTAPSAVCSTNILTQIHEFLSAQWTTRATPAQPNSFSPSFDVRESDFAFFLEGEFPGVGRKEDIVIEKLGQRTLLVQTTNSRFDIDAEWNPHGSVALASGNAEAQQQHGPKAITPAVSNTQDESGDRRARQHSGERDEECYEVRLAERRVGYLVRSFTFPSPVNIDALKARLRHGLLLMMIPKVMEAREDSRRIHIED